MPRVRVRTATVEDEKMHAIDIHSTTKNAKPRITKLPVQTDHIELGNTN
jgi:hypothetical protein